MKQEIYEILIGLSFNVEDQAGNKYIVVEEEDFDKIAEIIDKLYNEKGVK